jgi:hypothetical protein
LTERIVGGKKTCVGQFPWMVRNSFDLAKQNNYLRKKSLLINFCPSLFIKERPFFKA